MPATRAASASCARWRTSWRTTCAPDRQQASHAISAARGRSMQGAVRTRSSRSRPNRLTDTDDADLPELQPANAGLYCLAIAGNDDCELARLDVGGRGLLHRI